MPWTSILSELTRFETANCRQTKVAATKAEFEKVVHKYSKRVLNTAAKVLGNAQSAQDVHQEVFLSIWKRWHTYNGHTNWPAYLYRTTVRKALELTKKKRGFSLQSCLADGRTATKSLSVSFGPAAASGRYIRLIKNRRARIQ